MYKKISIWVLLLMTILLSGFLIYKNLFINDISSVGKNVSEKEKEDVYKEPRLYSGKSEYFSQFSQDIEQIGNLNSIFDGLGANLALQNLKSKLDYSKLSENDRYRLKVLEADSYLQMNNVEQQLKAFTIFSDIIGDEKLSNLERARIGTYILTMVPGQDDPKVFEALLSNQFFKDGRKLNRENTREFLVDKVYSLYPTARAAYQKSIINSSKVFEGKLATTYLSQSYDFILQGDKDLKVLLDPRQVDSNLVGFSMNQRCMALAYLQQTEYVKNGQIDNYDKCFQDAISVVLAGNNMTPQQQIVQQIALMNRYAMSSAFVGDKEKSIEISNKILADVRFKGFTGLFAAMKIISKQGTFLEREGIRKLLENNPKFEVFLKNY